MGIEENKANTIRLREEVWNKGNVDVIKELVSPEFYYKDTLGKEFKGIEGFTQMVVNWRKSFPDCNYTHDFVIAEGDWVSFISTFKGTFEGKLANFEPNGKKVSWTASAYMHWVDGKLVEMNQFVNYLSVFAQLGINPPSQN